MDWGKRKIEMQEHVKILKQAGFTCIQGNFNLTITPKRADPRDLVTTIRRTDNNAVLQSNVTLKGLGALACELNINA
jgi:hypothetical protein